MLGNPGPVLIFLFFARARGILLTFFTFWQESGKDGLLAPCSGSSGPGFPEMILPATRNNFRGTNRNNLVRDDSLCRDCMPNSLYILENRAKVDKSDKVTDSWAPGPLRDSVFLDDSVFPSSVTF